MSTVVKITFEKQEIGITKPAIRKDRHDSRRVDTTVCVGHEGTWLTTSCGGN